MVAIDIWSDIACPWCWVGKRRFEAARAAFDGDVEWTWHAFELNPQAPAKPRKDIDYVERLGRKYGTDRAGAQAMVDRMTDTAAAEGLTMRFDHIQPGNTFDAHRLVALARHADKQDAMKERLFAAYLEEGKAISDRSMLANVGAEVGLDADRVAEMLEGDELADEVRADERAAAELGIRGVPFFIVGGKLAFSGAQPSDAILDALRRARDS